MIIENLITDRTLANVTAVSSLAEAIKAGTATAEQVQQYLSVRQKGAYTHEDLNRVEEAVMYVAEKLKAFGYFPVLPVTRTWVVADKPNESDFVRYLGNVAMLRDAISVWASTPEAPNSMVGFDVRKANALEQILVDVDLLLTHISQGWFYSGDLYSAEV